MPLYTVPAFGDCCQRPCRSPPPFVSSKTSIKKRKKNHMAKTLRFSCDLIRICTYSLSLNLYPMPQMVKIYWGESGLGSIFFLSFRMKAMMLLSSSR